MPLTTTDPSVALEKFKLFSDNGCVTDLSSLSHSDHDFITRLSTVRPEEPLTRCQLNQYVTFAHRAPMSAGFFDYYFTQAPKTHPYKVTKINEYDSKWTEQKDIISPDQLYWGVYRFYVDALLFYGNIRQAYRELRTLGNTQLKDFFSKKCFDTTHLKDRGKGLPPKPIAKENRPLVSEIVRDLYESNDVETYLRKAFKEHESESSGAVSVRALIDSNQNMKMACCTVLDEEIAKEEDISRVATDARRAFEQTAKTASDNTAIYLSMVNELDVYVATSMRTAEDFHGVTDLCEAVFDDSRLTELNLRFFNPTMSVAKSHTDKGLIECLMVKCAKALIYCHGSDEEKRKGKDSFGKDAEAAMALSLGKPVVLFSPLGAELFRNVHPLTRLIEFKSGVAVGAMVVDDEKLIPELLRRILTNDLEYKLERRSDGYRVLRETLSDSSVRLQTSDELISETFWNHYHNQLDSSKFSGQFAGDYSSSRCSILS